MIPSPKPAFVQAPDLIAAMRQEPMAPQRFYRRDDLVRAAVYAVVDAGLIAVVTTKHGWTTVTPEAPACPLP